MRPLLRAEFEPDRVLYPFESRWFDGPFGRQHYLDEGAGRVIVLAHGNPTWSFLYRKMIPSLVAAGFRCVVPDMLGYGLSEHPVNFGFGVKAQADALSALIQALELCDILVVGQDWGGPVALAAVLQRPEGVRGVILGSTFAWRSSGVTRLIAHLLRSRLVQRWMLESETFIPKVLRLARSKLSERERTHYQAVAANVELRRAKTVLPRELIDADAWLDGLERSLAEKLGTVPALLLNAKKDAFLGNPAVRRFKRIFRDAVVVDLPRAGHFFQEDAPEEAVAAIVSRFASSASFVLDGR